MGDNTQMPHDRETADIKALQARIRLARIAAGYTQKRMADALGIKVDAYKKYEIREGSTMPLLTFAKFCEVTDTDPSSLLFLRHYPRQSATKRATK